MSVVNFHEFGINVDENFRENLTLIDIKGAKTTLEVGGEHISSNISEITEDAVFVLIHKFKY